MKLDPDHTAGKSGCRWIRVFETPAFLAANVRGPVASWPPDRGLRRWWGARLVSRGDGDREAVFTTRSPPPPLPKAAWAYLLRERGFCDSDWPLESPLHQLVERGAGWAGIAAIAWRQGGLESSPLWDWEARPERPPPPAAARASRSRRGFRPSHKSRAGVSIGHQRTMLTVCLRRSSKEVASWLPAASRLSSSTRAGISMWAAMRVTLPAVVKLEADGPNSA